MNAFFQVPAVSFLRCRWCDDLEDQNIQDSNPENSEKLRVFQRISWDFFGSQPVLFGFPGVKALWDVNLKRPGELRREESVFSTVKASQKASV